MKSTTTLLILAGFFLFHINFIYAQQDTSCVGNRGSATWYVYDNIEDNDLEDLYVHPSYPLSPTYELDALKSQSIYNFKNNYGSVMRGFIKAPVSGNYTFNITGNDRGRFFFSSGTDPANLMMRATTVGATGQDDHYNAPEQTSTTINLTEDYYYYFELHHKERMYSDHVTLYWKTPEFTDTLWRVIPGTNLYDYTCFSTCPPEGTACDDGNANTTNDVEDGYCNCIGEVSSSDPCVGNRGDVQVLFYENIPGASLNDLYNDPSYPLMPDTSMDVTSLNMPYNWNDEYGTVVKGYFRVPENGNYKFNITGDDQTRFYLSNGSNPSNISLIANIDSWTGRTEHYKFASQTSANIALTNNKFYYFELHHKEGGGGDHSNVFWKTPFRPDTNWMNIQGIFLHGYDCEDACLPVGTACNDHDENTENDAYDANCDCVGTPCGGPCETGENYTPNDVCAPSEGYSNNAMDSWLSCQKTANPNSTHGNSHWIMYDFDEVLQIERNRYWNYNVVNNMRKGAKTVVIDYSNNASSWTNLGTYTWAKAPGTNGYQGDSILDLNGVELRYLLITITEAHNHATCAGFSEILFDVRRCQPGGTLCDDGDPLTFGDMYDNHCNCRGIPEVVENPCDEFNLTVQMPAIPTDDYSAENKVFSNTSDVKKGNIVTFTAGKSVELTADFEVKKGASFYASIQPCVQPLTLKPPSQVYKLELPDDVEQGERKEFLSVDESSPQMTSIDFQISKKGPVSLSVVNSEGKVIQQFQQGQFMKPGQYSKKLPTSKLQPDVYHVILQTKRNLLRQRIVVTGDVVTAR